MAGSQGVPAVPCGRRHGVTPSQDVRPGSRRPVAGPSTLRGSACRLFEAAKPWLIVAVFLLILGLAGGVEVGTVWP
jgi:hypothetical protein